MLDPFPETPVATALGSVMREALDIVGRESPSDVASRVRQHLLDRWYRFEAFGITRRADLEPIRVVLSDGPASIDPEWGTVPAKLTSVSVAGTPLEGRMQ